MRRWIMVVSLVAACGRIGFDPLSGTTADGRVDGDGLLVGNPAAVHMSTFMKTTAGAPALQVVPHGLQTVPKAMLFWSSGTTAAGVATDVGLVVGMTDGTNSRSVSGASQSGSNVSNAYRRASANAIQLVSPGGMLRAEAALVSWNATSFTLMWNVNEARATAIHVLAIGGPEVEARVIDWVLPATAAPIAVGGTGFAPDVVIHLHAGVSITAVPSDFRGAKIGLGVMTRDGHQWALETLTEDLRTTSETQRVQSSNACLLLADDVNFALLKRAQFQSMDPDGFTLNFDVSTDPAPGRVFSLAMRGVEVHAGSFPKTTMAAPASQSVTGLPFEPSALVLASVQDVARASPVGHARLGLGAAAPNGQGAAAYQDTNAAAVTVVHSIDESTYSFVKIDNSAGTPEAACMLASLDPSGFLLTWSPNDAVATELAYLALR